MGFRVSKLFVPSQTVYGIDLIGPTRSNNHWQAKENTGFATCDFVIDCDHKAVTCPTGKTSLSWMPARDEFKNEVIKIKFGKQIALLVPVAVRAPARPQHAARLQFVRKPSTKRSQQAGNGSRPHSLPKSMRNAPELKAPLPKESVLASFADHATWAWQKRTSSIS